MLNDYDLYKTAQSRVVDFRREAEMDRLSRSRAPGKGAGAHAPGLLGRSRRAAARILGMLGAGLIAVSELLGRPECGAPECSGVSRAARSGC